MFKDILTSFTFNYYLQCSCFPPMCFTVSSTTTQCTQCAVNNGTNMWWTNKKENSECWLFLNKWGVQLPFLIWWERPRQDGLEEHKAAEISLINLDNIKGSLAGFIRGVSTAWLSLPARTCVCVCLCVCHTWYDFQEVSAWKKNVLAHPRKVIFC